MFGAKLGKTGDTEGKGYAGMEEAETEALQTFFSLWLKYLVYLFIFPHSLVAPYYG